jgi:hypothetical protein
MVHRLDRLGMPLPVVWAADKHFHNEEAINTTRLRSDEITMRRIWFLRMILNEIASIIPYHFPLLSQSVYSKGGKGHM